MDISAFCAGLPELGVQPGPGAVPRLCGGDSRAPATGPVRVVPGQPAPSPPPSPTEVQVGAQGKDNNFHRGLNYSGSPLHRDKRENGHNRSLSGKTQGIWKFCQNTSNLVCSSCKFPDSKGKSFFDICYENF